MPDRLHTPARTTYGKRKRHTSVPEIAWDVNIDKAAIDLNNNSPATTPKAKSVPYHASTSPSNNKGITKGVDTSAEIDVYSFDFKHQSSQTRKPSTRADSDGKRGSMLVSNHVDRTIQASTATYAARTGATANSGKSNITGKPFESETESKRQASRGPDKGKGRAGPVSPAKTPTHIRYQKDVTRTIELSKAEARALSYIDVGPSRTSETSPPAIACTSGHHDWSPEAQGEAQSTVQKQEEHKLSVDETRIRHPLDETTCASAPERSRTPVAQLIAESPSVQSTPQTDAIGDMFESSVTSTQQYGVRSRRILRQLSKLGNSPVKRQTSGLTEDIDGATHLDKLLESAENNLLEQSQGSVQDDVQEFVAETPEHSQSMQPSSRSTYLKQRSNLGESAFVDGDTATKGTHPRSISSASDGSDTENDELDFTSPKAVRNLHDLRHGGENKRFLEQANDLLEGLDSSQTQLATLLELRQKLLGKDFIRRFRAAGLENRLWHACQDVADPISIFVVIVLLSMLAQNLETATFEEKQQRMLHRAIKYEHDVQTYLENKSLRITKINRLSMSDLRKDVANSPIFKQSALDQRLSPRLLALLSMNSCTAYGAQVGQPRSFVQDLLAGFDELAANSLIELQLSLAVLESIPARIMSELATIDYVQCLTRALLYLTQLMSSSRHVSIALCSDLRLLISLANDDASKLESNLPDGFIQNCLRFILESMKSRKAILSTSEENVLMLGLLVTLVEESDITRSLVTEYCKSPLSMSEVSLTCLVRAEPSRDGKLLTFLKHALDEDGDSTTAGYIALLLFQLCYSDSSQHDKQATVIADRETVRAGLQHLHGLLTSDLSEDNEFMKSLSKKIDAIASS